MSRGLAITCMIGLIHLAALPAVDGLAQESRPGGYATTLTTSKEVVAAAAFAIEAQQKAIQEATGEASARLELVSIDAAEQQVVSGINYRLKLTVKLNDKQKMAEAIVWWQSWRQPNPYQLTSWSWK